MCGQDSKCVVPMRSAIALFALRHVCCTAWKIGTCSTSDWQLVRLVPQSQFLFEWQFKIGRCEMLNCGSWLHKRWWLLTALGLVTASMLLTVFREPTIAQQPAAPPSDAQQAEPAAPAGQTFVGTRECAACHFEQFMAWRQTPHAKAFEIMPAKYQADATCLKCHTTGHGTPTGFKSLQETPNLVGNSCEGCPWSR